MPLINLIGKVKVGMSIHLFLVLIVNLLNYLQ